MENKRLGCINRDKNSVNNIKKIALSILNGEGRPEKYTRTCNTNETTKKQLNPTIVTKTIKKYESIVKKFKKDELKTLQEWSQLSILCQKNQ